MSRRPFPISLRLLKAISAGQRAQARTKHHVHIDDHHVIAILELGLKQQFGRMIAMTDLKSRSWNRKYKRRRLLPIASATILNIPTLQTRPS
jgi:hypothetical protein